jgi:hypothetical protein
MIGATFAIVPPILWRFSGTIYLIAWGMSLPVILGSTVALLLEHPIRWHGAKRLLRAWDKRSLTSQQHIAEVDVGELTVESLPSRGSNHWATLAKLRQQPNGGFVRPSIQSTVERFGTAPSTSASVERHERGVSLAFLTAFVDEFGVAADEPTWRVCKRLCVVHTKPHQRCYYDMLVGAADARAQPWAGKQNVFLSHSWGCPFVNLLRTIEAFEAGRSPEQASCYYYIDLFSLNQHNLTEREDAKLLYDADAAADQAAKEAVARVLLETLDRAVQTAEHCLVAINAFDNAAPLTRIWCASPPLALPLPGPAYGCVAAMRPPLALQVLLYAATCAWCQVPLRNLEGLLRVCQANNHGLPAR